MSFWTNAHSVKWQPHTKTKCVMMTLERWERKPARTEISKLRYVIIIKINSQVFRFHLKSPKRCIKSRIIPKGLRSSLASIKHSSKSGFCFCRRIQFWLLRRTLRDKYELLSEIDNKIRKYDWNVRSFNLGSRFYNNFYAYA